MEKRGFGAVVAEFIGTFALVWTIILAVSVYGLQGRLDVLVANQFPFIALAHVLILLVMIQSLGAISGAHFNPAVTISMASIRKISVPDAAKYIAAQILGSIAAAGFAYLTIKNLASPFNFAATAVNPDIQDGTAFILEALATFFLVWAVIGTAVNPKSDNAWAPLTIAGTLGLGVLLIASLTGAGINPARSIGPALISGEWGGAGTFLLVYILGPVLGGLLATLIYKGTFMVEGEGETLMEAFDAEPEGAPGGGPRPGPEGSTPEAGG